MVPLRFAIPAIIAAIVVACFTYVVTRAEWVEADAPLPDVRLPPAMLYSTGPNARASTGIEQRPNADEQAAAAYQKAAEEILRRAPNTRASAAGDELPMTGRIPLPKKKPIAR
jgi:hypothetical protein